jgi:hypothetical protein
MPDESQTFPFPSALLYWAGHRQGGVRRLFHSGSGRPSGSVVETPLLLRLKSWAADLAHGQAVPRVVLLIGGPGNGKTEAVEATIVTLDEELRLDGRLVAELKHQFAPQDGRPVPRLVVADLGPLSGQAFARPLAIVQDASVTRADQPGLSPASALIDELEQYALGEEAPVYLACVNRGILDDALIAAVDSDRGPARQLLEATIRSVGLSPSAHACWPLHGYPQVAVWPMDVESLVELGTPDDEATPPAAELLKTATDGSGWPPYGACAAGERCPFCTSRQILSRDAPREALLRILRWYELATGKRWSFRDLFSLSSFMLAGVPQHEGEHALGPCDWAAKQNNLIALATARPESARLVAPFRLVASQYQHALFGRWPRITGRRFRNALKELRLEAQPALLGLDYFLGTARSTSIPETLDAQLGGLCDVLDPALADPDLEVEVSTHKVLVLRDIDARFSQSVGEGLTYVRRYLSAIETDLLQRLEGADEILGTADVRRRRPVLAKSIQVLLRDFTCRLVRRSLGVRAGIVRDYRILQDFERVNANDEQLLHEAVKQVEGLLNHHERFSIALNTTFGESLPPEQRRATLTTARQRVRPMELSQPGRPPDPMRFLQAGSGSAAQPIPLTYELYRSVRELKQGMLSASLPRPVVALLDTTRARLAGRVVRDEDALDGAEIRLGRRSEKIARELDRFVVHREDLE